MGRCVDWGFCSGVRFSSSRGEVDIGEGRFEGMLCVLRGSGSVWRNGGRAWMGTTSAVEDVVIRSREGGSCTVPLVFTKFDAKVVEVERKEGKRPPVLLLHGLLGSQMTYRSLVKRKDFGGLGRRSDAVWFHGGRGARGER